ncbi:MAG: aryl-sulfate sulfotransferase [Tepidisphaeraceae bacterium]|jgi:Raf kinase inhibitor-like YbhB/YbcL family protein
MKYLGFLLVGVLWFGLCACGENTVERKTGFVLSSPEVADGGMLPKDYTGDGSSATLPLEWSGAPAGTKSYALIMHHIDPQGITKWYWTLYNIPANVQSLPKNVKAVGTLGNNSVNERTEYAPPHSKGPGAKTYIYTVYALSAEPQITVRPAQVNRGVLLAAMKDRILAAAELKVVYTRPDGATEQGDNRPPDPPAQRADGQGGQAGGGQSNPGGPRLLPRSVEELLNLTEQQRQQIDDLETEARTKLGKILTPEQLKQLDQSRPSRPPQDGPGGDGPPPPPGGNDDRPPRPDSQGQGRNDGGGGGGRGATMPENKLPISPNPGQTVGLFLNTSKAYNGYTLFAPKHNTVTYLMDNQGRAVHQWKSNFEPGQSAHLLPNGHLLRAGMLRVQGGTGGGEGGRIEEYDWDGKLVWEFEHATRNYQLHHDIAPLPNGHVLALMVERKTIEQAVAAGFDRRQLRDDSLVPDAVVEIEPILPKGGRIVWEWHVWDHLIQNFDRTKANYGDVAAHQELVDVHCNGRASPAFWNHMNSIAYNAKLDQIMLTVRGCNEIWVLDHSTTSKEVAGHTGGKHGKGGDLIYRWGNPAAYQRGTIRDKQLIQQHDAEWIPEGYPGAGHITIFNNGYDRGWSSIEEIVPPTDADGRYTLADGKAYGPDKPVWHYEAKNRTDFFSAEISGAHRLPNGNTLICAGVIGNLFEITPAGEAVWQYVNPMVRGGILAQGEVPGKDMRGHLWNAVFKVRRYSPEYSGLAGRDLTSKGVIELPASEKGKTGLNNCSEQPRDNRDRPGQGGRQDRPPRDQ